LLAGQPGPVRDAVLLNAGAALVAMESTEDRLVDRLPAAMARCAGAIDSGAAADRLARWIAAARSRTESSQDPRLVAGFPD
jgi:anthranilate phosphoribosyltransferase